MDVPRVSVACGKCRTPMYVAGYHTHYEKSDGSKLHVSYVCHQCGYENKVIPEKRSEKDDAE